MNIKLDLKPVKYNGVGGFVAQVVVMTLAALLSAYLLPGVRIESVTTAIVVAVVIAMLNSFLRPILIVITLPLAIFTLGFFLLVINAALVMLTAKLVPHFEVDGFWDALLFGLLLTVLNYVLELPNRLSRRPPYSSSNNTSTSDDDDGFTPYEEVNDN